VQVTVANGTKLVGKLDSIIPSVNLQVALLRFIIVFWDGGLVGTDVTNQPLVVERG
jgi:hypothetical protein